MGQHYDRSLKRLKSNDENAKAFGMTIALAAKADGTKYGKTGRRSDLA